MSIKKLMISLCLLFPSISQAGNVTSLVEFIQINIDNSQANTFAVKFVSEPSGSPTCATDSRKRMAASLETAAGNAAYSMLLAAQQSGRKVAVYGNNQCSYGELEDIAYIRSLSE